MFRGVNGTSVGGKLKIQLAGTRWEETLRRCQAVKTKDMSRWLTKTEIFFINQLHDKLTLYKANATLTAKQLNWLSDIEGKLP